MRRLMLLRHAKSDRSNPGGRDHDRVLNARGREAAPLIGAYMASHGLNPDLVICSTAARARETWDLVAKGLGKPAGGKPPGGGPPTTFEERIYHNDPRILLELVHATKPGVHALLMVGHNPSFQMFADLMAASGHGDARQRLREKFPTAALAVIDFAVDAWDRVHPHSAASTG